MLVTNGIISKLAYILICFHLMIKIKLIIFIIIFFVTHGFHTTSQFCYDVLLYGQIVIVFFFCFKWKFASVNGFP